jgi:hypothetical protein
MKNGPRKPERRVLPERTEMRVPRRSFFNPVCVQRRSASTFSCGIGNVRALLIGQSEAGHPKAVAKYPLRKKGRPVVLRSPFMDQEFDTHR